MDWTGWIHREGGSSFRHDALLCADERAFLDDMADLIQAGLSQGAAVHVAVDSAKIGPIRTRLGELAAHVSFADMAAVGANPALIIPAWREFVDGHPAERPLLGVGEPLWPGRAPDELVECERHEGLLNLAFADAPNFWLACPYDISGLDPATVEAAERTHPAIVESESGVSRANPSFAGIEALSRPHDEPLPAVPPSAGDLTFGIDDLPALRSWVASAAAGRGASRQAVEDIEIAVSEVATNSVQHGGGRGRLRLWVAGDRLVCEVADLGSIRDPLVGRVKPSPDRVGGYGLWMVNHLCDLVQIRTGARGTVVRLHVALDR
jgi:anti-sigma regulatory factor (Ser/Thr protein kinase)